MMVNRTRRMFVHTRFFWDSPPAADFNNHISWTQLDKHGFAATRIRIVCVQTETAYDFHGPEPDTAAINSASAARKFTYKREPIVTRSSKISDTICKAVRDRVLNHITSKKEALALTPRCRSAKCN